MVDIIDMLNNEIDCSKEYNNTNENGKIKKYNSQVGLYKSKNGWMKMIVDEKNNIIYESEE